MPQSCGRASLEMFSCYRSVFVPMLSHPPTRLWRTGGVEEVGSDLMAFAWMVVKQRSTGHYGKAQTAHFVLPRMSFCLRNVVRLGVSRMGIRLRVWSPLAHRF